MHAQHFYQTHLGVFPWCTTARVLCLLSPSEQQGFVIRVFLLKNRVHMVLLLHGLPGVESQAQCDVNLKSPIPYSYCNSLNCLHSTALMQLHKVTKKTCAHMHIHTNTRIQTHTNVSVHTCGTDVTESWPGVLVWPKSFRGQGRGWT